MTSSYAQMLPLLVACFSAYVVADALGNRPIYEALLERDVRRDGATPVLQGTLVLELTVQPHSRFDGERVRDLSLPPGSILVTRRHGIHESVPTADTCPEAGDRVTAVLPPKQRQQRFCWPWRRSSSHGWTRCLSSYRMTH